MFPNIKRPPAKEVFYIVPLLFCHTGKRQHT